jgi:hypothetical protein
VETEYFSILDDDDYWLSDHIETLFAASTTADPDFDVSFSGTVCVKAEEVEKDSPWTHTIYSFGFGRPPVSLSDLTAPFSSNCFVARTALIPQRIGSLDLMETAEDSALVALLARNKRPVFSYKATAFFRRGFLDESDFLTSPVRQRDLVSLRLRAGMLFAPSWLSATEEMTGLEVARRFVRDGAALARMLAITAIGNDRRDHRRQVISTLRKLFRDA